MLFPFRRVVKVKLVVYLHHNRYSKQAGCDIGTSGEDQLRNGCRLGAVIVLCGRVSPSDIDEQTNENERFSIHESGAKSLSFRH